MRYRRPIPGGVRGGREGGEAEVLTACQLFELWRGKQWMGDIAANHDVPDTSPPPPPVSGEWGGSGCHLRPRGGVPCHTLP